MKRKPNPRTEFRGLESRSDNLLGLFSMPLFLFQVLLSLVEMIFKKTAYVICFKRFGKIDFKCIAIKIA